MRFAVLGAGNIARRFAASLAHEPAAELVAASCRTKEKADAFLREVVHAQGARGYGSHEELLADPDVDAIYLALPHALHLEWAVAALRAGKAVLCEKPATLSAAQMREVADVARDTGMLFMEAMKPRFVPLHQKVLDALPRIGELTRIEATLCNDMLGLVEGTGTYHMTPGPGAGVLLDCGIYCASWIADLCPAGPLSLEHVEGAAHNTVDVYADARLLCSGMPARLECAFDRAKPRQATLVGTKGRIVVDELHRPQHASVLVDGEEPCELAAPYEHDDFFGEIHHFVGLAEAKATESPIMSLADSIRCAEILDTVRAGLVQTSAPLSHAHSGESV